MKIDKENSMLIDIQYIKANKKEGNCDYLYIIWKNLIDNEKHLMVIPEPLMTIYFEKPEFRNHDYNKNYARQDELEPVVVKYKDIIYRIIDDIGPKGRELFNNYITTKNYSGLKEFYVYPYVFGADYDIRVWYRHEWMRNYENDLEKKITKGFLDIEVDTYEAVGMPDASVNPIDLVTVIDAESKVSYTFALIGYMVDHIEPEIKEMYETRKERQYYYANHVDELKEEAHKMFDENYPGMEYNFYFFEDELKMLTYLFQLINKLKLDFIGIWNISFDIPYIKERIETLGADPKDIMCHPDFPVKECWFKKDQINFAVKNKSDFFHCSSYTIFYDQMIAYAAIRKGQSELRSNRLTYIAQKEIQDEKLDYSEDGNIKTVSYRNYLRYVLYNIKDVLLQVGIEEKTEDIETYYLNSYNNLTPYESEFKQTVKLRNVEYKAFYNQGLIPGGNKNGFLYNTRDHSEDEDGVGFEGALVGDPVLNGKFGKEMYGKPSNSVFDYSIDFDMSAFYPSTIRAMNIDPSTLIFKMIVPAEQYDVRGGNIPYHGITDIQLNDHNSDSFHDDIAKEIMDNFQTKNYLSTGYKWLNLPSVNEVYRYLKEKE